MIIGLNGIAGAGKDSVADGLIQWSLQGNRELYPMRKESFAGGLKRACIELFGFADNAYEDRTIKEGIDPVWGFSPRWAAQYVGTDLLREHIADDFFIRSMISRCNKAAQHVVVSDVRFDNEAEWILSVGGIVLTIDAGDRIGDAQPTGRAMAGNDWKHQIFGWTGLIDNGGHTVHSSEQGLKKENVTAVIDNSRSLDEAIEAAIQIVSGRCAFHDMEQGVEGK
jgi:hypothetical protein